MLDGTFFQSLTEFGNTRQDLLTTILEISRKQIPYKNINI